MPECHKCPHNEACLRCKGPAEGPNNHGKTHVSVDLVKGFVPAPAPQDDPDPQYDAALHILRVFSGLGLIEREIVTARMRNEQYPSITTRLNAILAKPITVQGIHARAKKVVKNNPVLVELFRGMVIKQQNRKRKGTHSA